MNPDDLAFLADFIARRRWRFARTMSWHPHEYTVREWDADEAAFERAVRLIREHGYPGRFGKRTFTYLDLDGWKYWTMGNPIAETTIINRARLQRT